jgi:hypothetical protein
VSYFLGMAYNNADPDWVRDAVAHRPDANTAVWLAWLDPQNTVATGREWGAWLDLGLSRGEVTSAVEAGLRGGDVAMIARETNRAISTTARSMVAWARAGCFPTARQMLILARRGVDYSDPSRTAVDALVNDVDSRGLLSTSESSASRRTELGLMLMVLGTRHAVLLNIGTPEEIHDHQDADRL